MKRFGNNRRGQFSIIAALLVAVVLIAAVMSTYSTIRYSTMQDQPQVTSSIDEINLALKQVVGFTVGYYGSVLQVTGNTSYARQLASNYLQSGLRNIGDIRPEWGASFSVDVLNLRTNWFSNKSYSSGNLAITYNLTGIGLYNMTYFASSRLDVEIFKSSSNKAVLSVTKDESEPLINLAKQNLCFYHYVNSESTWELVTSNANPIVYANGTYIITVPAGVDPDSYVIKIEDQRGIIVVASSFSGYRSTLVRNSTYSYADYVDTNDSDMDSSADKGTQSNFNAQQSTPDSVYDTLAEINYGGGLSNVTLIDGESFENIWPPSGWSYESNWNKESNRKYQGTYCADFDGSGSGSLYTKVLDCSNADAIYIDFWFYDEGCDNNGFRLYYHDASGWVQIVQLGAYTENQWVHYQQKITETRYLVDNFQVRFRASNLQSGDHAYIDLVTIKKEVDTTSYQLDIEEQFINVNYTDPNQDLCIKASSLGSEPLRIDAWTGSTWVNIASLTGLVNGWKNVSVASYLTSSNFTFRFKGSSEALDSIQDSWKIDSVLLGPHPDFSFSLPQRDSTIVVEWLQNGTMRFLGQNLEMTTETRAIPPISVKALHLNETRNGVSQEVPFQVEDWASEYRIPMGLTSNSTVFSNSQMIVFLLDNSVSDFTLWWDGSDEAVQTPLAYTNRYFTDNPSARTLSNGRLALQFAGSGFTVTSTAGTTSSTTRLMRVNNEDDGTDPELAYVIYNGVIRDIIQGEPEYSGGAENCPNIYANVVITLPANATYYTYQLRFMFLNSTQPRSITNLCPIRLTTSFSSLQTENGTANGIPIVAAGTGTFYNYSVSFAMHHWSQMISGAKGAGIMFTDTANQRLYAFDYTAPGTPTGALQTSSGLIELLPVTLRSAGFSYPMDVVWWGAVVTFDSTTPIYQTSDGSGLWTLVEYPPTIMVTAEK
jgi:hypothetical protein